MTTIEKSLTKADAEHLFRTAAILLEEHAVTAEQLAEWLHVGARLSELGRRPADVLCRERYTWQDCNKEKNDANH